MAPTSKWRVRTKDAPITAKRDHQSGVMLTKLRLQDPPPPAALEFEVPGEPQPQGSHQAYASNGRAWVTSDNPRLRPWRNAVCWHAREALGERPPMRGPVRVELWFSFARPRGHFGRRGLLPSAPAGHVVRPDCDKLARGAVDALGEAGVWRDDSQVVELVASKAYAERSGLRVRVTEVVAP
ncbi:MAG: hypothetical protein DLM66_04825 [Candidatus Dormiibacter spiritus]|uniref:RusA family crossover junction endodeoxyribonuclease n=1 Tax=Candidatus Dormibacter sp. TaxID=2973982 RepID=UPI000DB051D6|nr:MAG: hypothetical protein DLM66_04825 [Candidatus Dormibacteraeota bacterium]